MMVDKNNAGRLGAGFTESSMCAQKLAGWVISVVSMSTVFLCLVLEFQEFSCVKLCKYALFQRRNAAQGPCF